MTRDELAAIEQAKEEYVAGCLAYAEKIRQAAEELDKLGKWYLELAKKAKC